jgi:hypothetical protein
MLDGTAQKSLDSQGDILPDSIYNINDQIQTQTPRFKSHHTF